MLRFIQKIESAIYGRYFSPISLVNRRAAIDSARFVEKNLGQALLFPKTAQLRDFVFKSIKYIDGVCCEFGVYQGDSINYYSEKLPQKQFYGFDTFTGLTEDWAGNPMPSGTFDIQGKMPKTNPNVEFIKGDILTEAPRFFGTFSKKIAFVHIDCDLYKPASVALVCVKPFLTPGAVILFDDFFNYPGWREGEYKALLDNFAENEYVYLGFSKGQAAIRYLPREMK